MSGSNWSERTAPIALGAIFAALIVFSSYQFGRDSGLLETEPHQHSNAYNDRSDEQIKGDCIASATVESAIKCVTEQKNRTNQANQEHRTNHDLTAQRAMAKYAWWMIVVTFGTLLTAAAGIYYLRDTLKETRRIGETQTRAYVHAKDAEIKSTYDGTFDKIILTVENVGETPAKWFSVGVEFRFGEDTEITKHAEISVVDRVWGPIAPNTPLTVNTTLPDEQRMNEVAANFEAIIKGQSSNIGYILGRIRYCTIYDEIFATEFIFAYRQHNGDKMFRPMSVMRAFEPSD